MADWSKAQAAADTIDADHAADKKRIAELEAALFCALHGREIVVEPGEGGPVECVPLGENRVLWRRKKTKRG